jgi:hypothetical protein
VVGRANKNLLGRLKLGRVLGESKGVGSSNEIVRVKLVYGIGTLYDHTLPFVGQENGSLL